jgi:hypothetical protein
MCLAVLHEVGLPVVVPLVLPLEEAAAHVRQEVVLVQRAVVHLGLELVHTDSGHKSWQREEEQ